MDKKMVGNVHGSHSYHKSPGERIEEHREDPDRVTSGFTEDELMMKYLSATKRGLWTQGTRYARGGLVGWFDFTEQEHNEMNETRSPVLPRQSSGSQYHSLDLIIGEMPDAIQFSTIPNDECRLRDWRDLFTGGRWTDLSPDRFTESNWGEIANKYTVQPDFLESSAPDSIDAGDGQTGLDEFTGELSPCGYSDVRQCSCCRCIHCGAASIRARQSKEPTYSCNNPSCDGAAFDSPDIRPGRRSD